MKTETMTSMKYGMKTRKAKRAKDVKIGDYLLESDGYAFQVTGISDYRGCREFRLESNGHVSMTKVAVDYDQKVWTIEAQD